MKRLAFIQALILFCLLAGSWVLLITRFSKEEDSSGDPPRPVTAPEERTTAPAESPPADSSRSTGKASRPAPLEIPVGWHPWIEAFRSVDSPASMRLTIADLQEEIFSRPRAEAMAYILEFLQSGVDVRTGLAFQTGPDGQLRGAASLRALLLSWLRDLDPEQAAELAKEELAELGTRLSPDEFAVHLRNYAWSSDDPVNAKTAFLKARFGEFISHDAWMQEPGTAVAKAFDVAVYTEATEYLPAITGFMEKGRPQMLREAAAVTIERLVDKAPLETLGRILEDTDLGKGLFMARAGYFARLDPSIAGADALFDSYLNSPDVSPREVDFFLQSFPNLNQTFSYALIGNYNPSTNAVDYVARIENALRKVREWREDPDMTAHARRLASLEERLASHLPQFPVPSQN